MSSPVIDVHTHDLRSIALGLAIEAGAIAKCPRHGCTFLGAGSLDEALRLAESRYSQLKRSFGSREELAGELTGVVREHYANECPLCTKWMDE